MLQLHVPCILFGASLHDSPLAARIAAQLGFAPHVQQLADRIIRTLLDPSPTYSFHPLLCHHYVLLVADKRVLTC